MKNDLQFNKSIQAILSEFHTVSCTAWNQCTGIVFCKTSTEQVIYPKLLDKQVHSIQNDIAITNRFTNTQI